MDVNMKGAKPRVVLHKPETARLERAVEVLDKIALIPCAEQELARDTAKILTTLAASLARRSKGKCIDGQQAFPFGDDGEPAAGTSEETTTPNETQ